MACLWSRGVDLGEVGLGGG
ncbi:hypothetical protein CFP56_033542 [Quercus suber]|uniref:Uncharacterized protein n=1 Tax=Quercus suber TaxID=58331 RepID=A0AAW0JEM6_QUESU